MGVPPKKWRVTLKSRPCNYRSRVCLSTVGLYLSTVRPDATDTSGPMTIPVDGGEVCRNHPVTPVEQAYHGPMDPGV